MNRSSEEFLELPDSPCSSFKVMSSAGGEGGFVHAVGESGTNGESSVHTYTLSSVEWIAGESLPCNREPSLLLHEALEGWDGGREGRLGREQMDV